MVSKPAAVEQSEAAQSPAVEDESCPDLLKAFLWAGSSLKGTEPMTHKDENSTRSSITSTIPLYSKVARGLAGIPQKNLPNEPVPASQDSVQTNDKFMTRGEVSAMINSKVAELTAALATPITPVEVSAGPVKQNLYRHHAICDLCDKNISGTRWKCLECPDFDTCQDCWSEIKKQHAGHRFVRIKDDALVQPFISRAIHTHPGVLCDGPLCTKKKSPIKGDRYKCTICSDFDLCAGCEVYPATQHNSTHPMIKMKRPISKINVSFEHDKCSSEQVAFHHNDHTKKSPFPTDLDTARPATVASGEFKETLADIGAKVRKAMSKNEFLNRPVKHLTVSCDICNSMVMGARFMCATCADFDLCESCYERDQGHPSNHVFVRYNHFVNNIVTSRLRIDAIPGGQGVKSRHAFYCNECDQSPIIGKRYNCLSCKDYDACEACKNKHEHTHAMQILPVYSSAEPLGDKDTDQMVDFFGRPIKDSNSAAKKFESIPQIVDKLHKQAHQQEENLLLSKAAMLESIKEAKAAFGAAWRASTTSPISPPPVTTESESCTEAPDMGEEENALHTSDVETKSSAVELEALSADFVEDVSIPDGTVVCAGASFVKQWLITNDGTVAWPAGVKAIFVGGTELKLSSEFETLHGTVLEAAVQPGQSAVVSIFLQAPDMEKSNVVSYYRLVTPDAEPFGCKLWVDFDVKSTAEMTSPAPEEVQTGTSATTASTMIFPSASMELPKSGPPTNDSVSNAGTQHEETWGSEDEVVLSDDEDYDVLDIESFSEDD